MTRRLRVGEYRAFPDSDPVSFLVGFVAEPGVSDMFSDETRMLIARGDFREAKADAAEADAAKERYEAREWKLQHDGAGREHLQVLADASVAQDRQDRRG